MKRQVVPTVNPTSMPRKIGRYLVSREIGRGGMGRVYEAHDPFIDRRVAIKVCRSEDNAPEPFQTNFFHEARAAGKMIHPHIVSLYDAMVEPGRCYLVMEYVDGPTLKEFCRRENLLPIDHAMRIILQCAKGLDYAHRSGVVHRDIKPSNIMVARSGGAKITDFGIAVVAGASEARQPGCLRASTFYTAPELLKGDNAVSQADLFSLGAVFYELITGTRPFEGQDELSTFYKLAYEQPRPIKTLRSDIPESLERIIGRALEKKPEDRYHSGMEMASDLIGAFEPLRNADETIDMQEKLAALKKVNFFREFTSSELVEVLKVTWWYRYDAGSTIISEGDVEDCFYIIISGMVTAKKRGRPLASLRPGDCFGEMAYFGKTRRTATIEAVVDTILMKIQTSSIDERPVATQLKFHKGFSTALIQRLSKTSEHFCEMIR